MLIKKPFFKQTSPFPENRGWTAHARPAVIPTFRRMLCLFALVLGAGGALAAGLPFAPAPRPVVRVAIFPHEPGTFLDAQGRPAGLFVEVLQEVAEREGWDLQFRLVPWAETLELARKGEVDLVTTVARNPEREAFLDFGAQPAYTMWTLLYVARGTHLEDVTALKGRTVALMRGDRNGQQFVTFCQRISLDCTFQEKATFDEVLEAVASGRADAGIASSLYGYWHEGRFAVHRTPVVLNPFPVYFAGPKGRSQPLLAALDRFLSEAHSNGPSRYHEIRDRWLHPAETRALPAWLQKGIPLLVALLALATGAVVLFQRQVRRATARIRDLNVQLSRELEARKRSEGRLDTLARLNADFLFACRHEGSTFREREWITDAFYRLTGYTPADLEAQGCWLFAAHPEDRPAVEAAFAALPPGGRDTRTFRLLTRDGRIRWVRCHTEAEADGMGLRIRRLGSVEDITDQVQAERRLAESRQELQAVYDQAPVMLCVLNADRRVVFANQAFIAFTGLPEEAVLAHRIGTVLHCPFAGTSGVCGTSSHCGACSLLDAIGHTLATGEPTANTPYRIASRTGGGSLHLLASTRRLDHPEGPRLLVSLLDVSELREAEQALLEAKAQYQTIVEASPTAILVARDGRYTYANAAAAEMLGCEDPRELVGKPLAALLREEDAEEVRRRVERTLQGLSNPPIPIRFRRSDGSLVDTEARSAPIQLSEGRGSLVLAEDITQRKRSEILRRSRTDLAEFALGHSLKELLRHTLDLLEDLTESRIGFFHFLDEDQNTLHLQTWSTRTLSGMCTAEGEGSHYPVDQAGVWVDALRQGRSVIHNDYPALPHRKGLPEGHAPVLRELVTPIQRGGRVVGILGVGNKPTPYTPADLEVVEQVAHVAWDIIEGKRKEEALVASEGRNRALLEANPDLMFLFSAEGRILDYKAEESASLLVAPENFLGKSIHEVLPAPLADLTAERIRACMGTRSLQQYDYAVGDAPQRWFESRMVPCGPEACLAIVREVTESRRTQEALRASEERFRLAMEASSDGLWDWDLSAGTLYFSPRAFTMLGYPANPLTSPEAIFDLIHPDERPSLMIDLDAWLSSSSEFWVREFRLRRSDGAYTWVLSRGRKVAWDAQGRPLRVLGTHVDLTEQKTAEAAILEREQRLQQLASATDEGLIVHDRGVILDLNEAALRMHGAATPTELIGASVFDLLAPESHALGRANAEDDAEHTYEAVGLRKDGARFPIRIHSRPIRWYGQPVRVASIQDLSTLQRLESEVAHQAHRFDLLFRYLPGALFQWRVRPDGRDSFDMLSPQAKAMFGLDPGHENPSRDLAEHLHPEDRERFLKSIEQAVAAAQEWDFDGRLLEPDGRVRWFHGQSFPVPDGEDLVFHGILLDTTDRMGALEALVDREAKLQAVFSQAAVGMVLGDARGRIEQVNDAYLNLLGYDRETFLKLTYREFTPAEDLAREAILAEELVQGSRESYSLEKRNLRADGRAVWVQVHVSRVFEPIRERTRYLGVIVDIDARKQAELELAESEARFRTLFHTHNAPFFLMDPESGEIIDANAAALRYYGYTAEEMRALHIRDINALSPEDLQKERRKAIRREQNYFIFPHRLKSGEVRTVEVYSSPVLIQGRELLFSIVHDISERVEVEDALRQSERRFRLLMNASSDAIFLHAVTPTEPGGLTEVSQAACDLLGFSREELIGRSPRELLQAEDHVRETETFAQLSAKGRLTFERTLIRKDGSPVQVEISSQIVEVDRRRLVLSIARDITERRRAQALDTATEGILAKGRMAAYIAHEINNPLAGIKSAFRLVADAVPADHPQRRYVELINQEITRIGNIVKTMYELYKPASTLPTEVLLEAVLQDVATLLAPKARAHRASLDTELPDPLLRATVQADLLRQILFNLVQNALEASPPQGRVRLRAEASEGRLRIRVVDEGPGIPPDMALRIFDAGFSTKHAAGSQMGLGLGLGSARKLAEGMAGSLTFANNSQGKGCTFTLDLPLNQHGIQSS